MIAKVEVDIKDKDVLLAILVAKTNELIKAMNHADKNPHSQQSSWD